MLWEDLWHCYLVPCPSSPLPHLLLSAVFPCPSFPGMDVNAAVGGIGLLGARLPGSDAALGAALLSPVGQSQGVSEYLLFFRIRLGCASSSMGKCFRSILGLWPKMHSPLINSNLKTSY